MHIKLSDCGLLSYDRMQSVQIVTFVSKELDQQIRKYNKVHQAETLRH